MFHDFLFASAHHLLFFGLIAMLVFESALLSRRSTPRRCAAWSASTAATA